PQAAERRRGRVTQHDTDAVGREGRTPAPDGVVVVDKPPGWTSHDFVARMRRLAATRRVGHAGTLDPMATGVVVLGGGRATKLFTFSVAVAEESLATVRLGAKTETDCAEGEIDDPRGASAIDPTALAAAAAALTREISQVPSSVSAIKVDGTR